MIADDDDIICDKEVARLLKISVSCLRRQAVHGPSSKGPRVVDIRLAKPIVIAGMRRWSRTRVQALMDK